MVGVRSRIDRSTAACPEAQLIGGTLTDNQDAARKASPVTYVSPDDPPFLIVHGEEDMTVPFNQSEILEAALKKAGVDATLVRVKRGGHGFRGDTDPTPPQIDRRVLAFFDKHLKVNPAK
jgi:dipeptidyl aminopeptidase/acylaminoacyl peptidase